MNKALIYDIPTVSTHTSSKLIITYLICMTVLFYHVTQQAFMAAVFVWTASWLLFVPDSGFFPFSDISLMELDQLGVLVTIIVVLGMRWGAVVISSLYTQGNEMRYRTRVQQEGDVDSALELPNVLTVC